MRTGFVSDPLFLQHRDRSGNHPECPERLQSIAGKLIDEGISERLIPVGARQADDVSILRCHTQTHVDRIRKALPNAPCHLDADTYLHPDSLAAALTACGGVMQAVDAIMDGTCGNVFCAVRPPGHHAESDRAMGFCLFNNAAIGARYAQVKYGLQRIFVLDWDVHHGNGTQEIFYEDDSVFYFSTHQFPLYPGTGRREENGKGRGLGYTRNIPLPAGSGDAVYQEVFADELNECIKYFDPELLIISAGFDAHERDPLAQMRVTTEGFAEMTRIVKNAAEHYCRGRLISVLEGGYDLKALADSVCAHIQVLMHD